MREALIELIEERGFDALTVGEITERAMVSRAAFYRNYQDKYDLVEQIFEEAMQRPVQCGRRDGPGTSPADLGEVLRAHRRIRTALPGAAGPERQSLVCDEDARLPGLAWSKSTGACPTGSHPAITSPIPFPDEFVPDLVATMFVEAITWWLEQERPYPPKEIAMRCALLVSAIFKETSTWQ